MKIKSRKNSKSQKVVKLNDIYLCFVALCFLHRRLHLSYLLFIFFVAVTQHTSTIDENNYLVYHRASIIIYGMDFQANERKNK